MGWTRLGEEKLRARVLRLHAQTEPGKFHLSVVQPTLQVGSTVQQSLVTVLEFLELLRFTMTRLTGSQRILPTLGQQGLGLVIVLRIVHLTTGGGARRCVRTRLYRCIER